MADYFFNQRWPHSSTKSKIESTVFSHLFLTNHFFWIH